ncbi:MAG: hypothetical protein CSB49_02690 [Proteobacteria bacterium]|nr:MAG: hypothetical protein CSB49_02690 [Pseudomonadota bacterium]
MATMVLAACPGPAGPNGPGRGPGAGIGPKVGRPGWIPKPNRSHPDKLFVTGSCHDQPNVRAARTCAIADAAKQVRQQLGAAMAVTIKGQFVEDEYNERRSAGAAIVIDGWVLVAYPRAQVAKAETRIANRAMLGVACGATVIGACDNAALEAKVLAAMGKAGLKAAPGKRLRGADAFDGKLAMKMAAKARAAKVLTVVITPKPLGSEDGEFYAQARCDYRLIDAVSGKVLTSNTYGPIKGGHISKKSALAKAIDNCMAKLLPAVETMSY